MTEGRSIDLSVEVPGTPEEVWDTIATGPGITSWFVPMEVEGHNGGEILINFGDYGKETATVTTWEPPNRLVYEGGGERLLAYEWLVEARDGGTCIVRLVNTGFGAGEEWDGDYDGMSSGWRIFLQHLVTQLTHFRGRRASKTIIPNVMVPGPNDSAWTALCESLGIPDDLREGDRLQTSGDAPPLSGTVQQAVAADNVSVYLLLLDGPAPGTAFIAAEGDGSTVACSLYLYLYGSEADSIEDTLTPWLRQRWPGPMDGAQEQMAASEAE